MRLPIGVQDFASLRLNGFVYVDKTRQIADLLESGQYLFLSRPRRFGKSLLLSTLRAIFEGRKELFTGLWLENHHDFKPRPVIRLDFSNINFFDKPLEQGIFDAIQRLARQQGITLTSSHARDALEELVIEHAKTAPVVILIDEYDKPITDVLLDSDKRELHQAILKNFYGILKSLNEYIHLVFLTGVSKIGKLSLFSDLNNLQDISLNPRFADLLGYTREEITQYFPEQLKAVADQHNSSLEVFWQRIQYWYNGYSWDGVSRLYCPFSFLLFLENKELRSYWYETGTPTFLLELIRSAQLNPIVFDSSELPSHALVSTEIDRLDPISLMFQTGYLTIAQKTTIGEQLIYKLNYPNQEVRQAFSSGLLQEYASLVPSSANQIGLELQRALVKLDWDTFFAAINRTLAAVPYEIFPKQEIFVHSLVHIMLVSTGFKTQSQVQTSLGRMDTLVETPTHSIILEYKTNGTAGEALSQIETARYAEGISSPVIKVGVRFDLEKKQISSWAVGI